MCAAGVDGRLLDELERRSEAAHPIQVGHRGEQLRRRVGVHAEAAERLSRTPVGRERAFPRALQLVDDGEAPVELGRGARIVPCPPRLRRLLPGQGRDSQLAGQLGGSPDPLQERAPSLRVVRRPQLERAAGRLERVAVGVHGGEVLRGRQQRPPRAGGLARGRPVLGHQRGPGAALFEQLGQPPVEGAPPGPRNIEIEGLPGERVAKRGDARLDLDDDAER